MEWNSNVGDPGPPGDLGVQVLFQLLVLGHHVVVVAALDVVFHEAERGLLELLLGVLRQQGAVDPAEALDGDQHQAAVLLGELDDLQILRDVQLQVIDGVHPLQQLALLGLGGDDDAVLVEQLLEIIDGDILPGDGALADSRKHGVGERKADENLIAGVRITHSDDLPAFFGFQQRRNLMVRSL